MAPLANLCTVVTAIVASAAAAMARAKFLMSPLYINWSLFILGLSKKKH
jgi:hypothetical protein